jgi:replicative DNA helicase
VSISRAIERVPPQNVEAEQSVLGSMLLDRDAIARVVEALRPEDFYRDAHRTVFIAMLELFERGEPVDLITLTDKLATAGKLEDIGGAAYLAALPNTVPTAANAEYYAGIVLEKAMLRALITAGTQIAALGYEGMDEVAALVDQAEKLVYGIAARRNMQDFQTIKEILKLSFEKIDKRYRDKGTVTGIPTGFTDLDMMTSGLQPSDMIIVAARPSVGKCLAADSEILLDDGRLCTIEELCRRRRGRILTLGPDWAFRFTEPSAYVDDGEKPAFRVTTRLGRSVECTAVHPFLTTRGWMPLAALAAGDRIAVPSNVAVFGDRPMRDCEVKLLAYFIGDGSWSGQTAALTNRDPRVMRDFTDAASEFGGVRCREERRREDWRTPAFTGAADRPRAVSRRQEFGSRAQAPVIHPPAPAPDGPASIERSKSAVVRWLTDQGLWGKRAADKFIPSDVFALPRPQLALFLNRLFATDGWACTAPRTTQAQIGCAAMSRRLARQMQHLLLRFGIIASVHRRVVRDGSTERTAWTVQITDPPSIKTFAAEIGMLSKESRLRRVLALLEKRQPARTAGAIPSAVRASIAAAKPRDVYWDEIAAIEPVGTKRVYDLTVSETHNFVANDMCVHNTTFALNLAQQAAINHKIPVAIFSLETSREQLVQRILCSEARVDNSKLRTGYLADDDWRKLARAMGSLSEAPIFIDDSATLSVMEMRAKARKLKAEHGLGLIVIDYIQLIQSFKRVENRTQELSEIARGIKSLAKELDLPIVAISQLSRAVETMGSRRPMLSHLRECVTGDTVVWDADTAARHTVAELAGVTAWPRLLSLDHRGRLVGGRPAAVFAKGQNDVFEIGTSTGRRLSATAHHPVLTPEGWQPVGQLTEGSLVAAARALPVFSPPRQPGFRLQTGKTPGRPTAPARAERLNAADIREAATRDVLWDRIISIAPRGPAQVYDLVMPGTHNFIANGLVAHNSGEIEQVSDLVVFLYREDYYDPERAQKDNKENVCELIIAKHRNGPIGSVELYFHKEYSRFANLDRRR